MPPIAVLRKSPEDRSDNAPFQIHRLADTVEFGFRDLVAQCNLPQRDPDIAWQRFYDSRVLDLLTSAVASFVAMTDQEMISHKPQRGMTPSRIRLLVVNILGQLLTAVADRRFDEVRARVTDLQTLLDPDLTHRA